MAVNEGQLCQSNLIGSYVDGELSESVRLSLEEHLESCAPCRDDLRMHRLLVCELDAALAGKVEVTVPANFSRIVAARAVSDMSGVRSSSENRKAITICAVLALLGFALLGAAARESLVAVIGRIAGGAWRLSGFLAATVYDTAASITVIIRVLTRKVIVETGSMVPLTLVLALAVFVLSRLITNYHRTGATE